MITNLVVALMVVSTKYTPVSAMTPYNGWSWQNETLYRMEASTNFVFVSDIQCESRSSKGIYEIARSLKWVDFCNCPCHKNGCK